MTVLQRAIRSRGAARRAYLNALKEEARMQRERGCPDDDTIYRVYITETQLMCLQHTVILIKQALAEERQKRKGK